MKSFNHDGGKAKQTTGHTILLHLDSGPSLIDSQAAVIRIANAVDSNGTVTTIISVDMVVLPEKDMVVPMILAFISPLRSGPE